MAFNPSVSARTWGTQIDAVSSSVPLLTSIQIMPTISPKDTSEISFTKDDKLPHHASVFVGSLPSNIDQGDLTRMLMEHLSEHTQVKNIKVVRDSKGGVCAFVQCEDADSAAGLIQTLHSGAPKPFLGRILRYEPARAFRTLLVSYRTPTKFVRPGGINHLNMFPYHSKVELELPHAMRIWKHSNSKFHSIVYNSDAIQVEENGDLNSSDVENAIFLKPLEFNEETLRKLVSFFGRLEKFSSLQASKSDEENHNLDSGGHSSNVAYSAHPQPHNAARASMMDPGCWEVKWEHRDACVSALMTLRRVPHLTVTWAHQPASPDQTFNPKYHLNSSPSCSLHAQHRDLSSQIFSSPNGSTSTRSRYQPSNVEKEGTGASNPTTDEHISPAASQSDGSKKHDPLSETIEQIQGLDLTGRQTSDADGHSLTLINPATDQDDPEATISEHALRENADVSQDWEEDDAQELSMPPTPALDNMSITPLTAGSQFPITPMSSVAEGHISMYYDNFEAKEKGPASFKNPRVDREIDPSTLFVGGLEMFGPGAWDEEKVTNFFARFGGLESVKLVRPLNSCSAFAFVKFNNPEAPARAVFEEHNRVYEGRAMRVQLRDCNPPRNWKYGQNRGRGRPHQAQFGPQRRFHYRPSYDNQEPISLQLQKEPIRQMSTDSDKISDIHLSTLAGPLSSVSRSTQDDRSIGTSSLAPPSLSNLSSAARQSPPIEKYREWYDEPESSSHTPEPSSLGSSVSMTGPALSSSPYAFSGVPHGPYFPPQPWVQPYLPQGPYQMPYYSGYPVYPPGIQPPTHQTHANPPSPEGSAPPIAQPGWPHMGVYGSYIPYPAVFPRPAVVDQSQMPQMSNQAPLIPTGFIQNEQGTLIPVYQPEALNQYMTSSGAVTSIPVTSHSPSSGPPRWSNASPYPHSLSNMPSNTSNAPPNQGLNRPKNPGFSPTTQHFSDFQPSSATLHSSDASFNNPSPLYRRQGQRREGHQDHSSVHNHNHPRSYGGRLSRGHVYNSGKNQSSDLGHSTAPSALPNNNWNRWSGGGSGR